MRLTGSRAYTRPILLPKMPPGLVEVMEGLTKDVLKNNPTNVYEFCADYMQKLLEIRDGKSIKMSLTLEEKICKAQEKVRQRAEHRWQNYVLQSETNKDKGFPPDNISRENLKTSIVPPLLQNSSIAPIYHDKVLAADSEIEISQELFDKIETVVKNSPNVGEKKDANVNVININLKNDEEETGATNEICDVKSVNAMEIDNQKNDPEHILIGENDNSLKNENKEPNSSIEIDHRNTILDSKFEIENNTNEINNALKNENQNKESNSGLDSENQNEETVENNNQNEDTIFALKNEENIEDIANITENENKGKDSDGASGNGNQNKNINIELENMSQNVEADKILQDETLKDDMSIEIQLNHNNFSNYQDSELNIAGIVPSHVSPCLGGNEENNHLKFDESEQRLENQTTEVTSDKGTNNTNYNNLQEFPKVEINIYSTEKTVEVFHDIAEQNDQSGVHDSITTTKSNIFSALSENPEKICAPSSNTVISCVNTDNSSNKNNDSTNVEDNKKQPNMFLNIERDSSASPIFKGNYENNETSCDKTNEKCLVNSMLEQDIKIKIFDEDTKIEKKDIFENRDEHDDDEVVKESNPDRDITFIKRSVSEEDDSVVKDDSTALQSYEPPQDEGNEHGKMNLETAAVTIQKVFRNFLFKSRAESTFDDTVNDDANVSDEDSNNKTLIIESEFSLTNSSLNKERRGLGITRMDTVLQTVNEEKSLSLSTDDSSTLSSAATIIQSHVRGFLVRNKLNSYRTVSNSNSLVNSNPSLETDTDQLKNKTVLNIHIVPEGSNLSREESIITSMDLSLDSSPPSSINLHPLGYDKSERRKQLKREDAIQSISPPSNNSGKLSEDSVKDAIINEIPIHHKGDGNLNKTDPQGDTEIEIANTSTDSTRVVTLINAHNFSEESSNSPNYYSVIDNKSLTKMSSDEMDVVTPFVPIEDKISSMDIEKSSKLVHSGEFHDMVLPTKVSRSDTSIVREFKNVLVYILLWNHS